MTTQLGHVARQQQRYELAKAHYREALVSFRPFSSLTNIAGCLEGFAAIICAEGRYAQAVRLCAAASTMREQAQSSLPQAEREVFEHTVATARAALDEASFKREWNIGMLLTLDQAIDYALSDVCA